MLKRKVVLNLGLLDPVGPDSILFTWSWGDSLGSGPLRFSCVAYVAACAMFVSFVILSAVGARACMLCVSFCVLAVLSVCRSVLCLSNLVTLHNSDLSYPFPPVFFFLSLSLSLSLFVPFSRTLSLFFSFFHCYVFFSYVLSVSVFVFVIHDSFAGFGVMLSYDLSFWLA